MSSAIVHHHRFGLHRRQLLPVDLRGHARVCGHGGKPLGLVPDGCNLPRAKSQLLVRKRIKEEGESRGNEADDETISDSTAERVHSRGTNGAKSRSDVGD